MRPDFPPEFNYDKQRSWSGSNKTETISGPYRGLRLLANATKEPLKANGGATDSMSQYRRALHVAIELARPLEYLAITVRPPVSLHLLALPREEIDAQPEPLHLDKVDYGRALSIGYPPFDDRYLVSSYHPALVRTVVNPGLVQWLLADPRSAQWKITFMESKIWASAEDNALLAQRVFSAADFLIDLFRYTQPHVVPAMPGAVR